MRSFIAAFFLAGTALVSAQTDDILGCASAALDGIDPSKFSDCTDLTSAECLCTNKDALSELTDAAKSACKTAGLDLSSLKSALCDNGSKGNGAAPARHASQPMKPGSGFGMEHNKRAYSPSMDDEDTTAPRVVYVTETHTHTECSCKSTALPQASMHISQIPVQVPASSSMMGAMRPASTPAFSHGAMMAASSSVIFGSISAATPMPSGASGSHFNTFEGAAPKTNAIQSGIAAFGVAAILGLIVAL